MVGSLLLAFVLAAAAAPKELEVWFLSPPSTSRWEHLLAPKLPMRNLLAQACEPVGDYCFDSRLGLYPKTRVPEKEFAPPPIDEGLPQLPTATSLDRKLVNCDAQYAFDIFCGRAKREGPVSDGGSFEIWIDVSSSMRAMDPESKDGGCFRSQLVTKMRSSCKAGTLTVKGFDTSLRDLGSAEGACVNQGMNNAKRLMEWVEESKAEKILLITDVYEYQAELAQFLEEKVAKIRGDRGSFPAAQMLDQVTDLAKACE